MEIQYLDVLGDTIGKIVFADVDKISVNRWLAENQSTLNDFIDNYLNHGDHTGKWQLCGIRGEIRQDTMVHMLRFLRNDIEESLPIKDSCENNLYSDQLMEDKPNPDREFLKKHHPKMQFNADWYDDEY